jgi:hypothetical protein
MTCVVFEEDLLLACIKFRFLSSRRLRIRFGTAIQPEARDAPRHQPRLQELASPRIDRGQIHQLQVAPKHLIPADAFVVVQEVAATVEHQTIAVNLGGLRMM